MIRRGASSLLAYKGNKSQQSYKGAPYFYLVSCCFRRLLRWERGRKGENIAAFRPKSKFICSFAHHSILTRHD